jgi:hypothetical protein
MSMGNISAILPSPRPVTLGEATYRVGELRLCDIAKLQGWLDSRWPNPMDALRDKLPDMEEAERRDALRQAHDEATKGPPCWGDERSHEEFRCVDGLLTILRVALLRSHPGLSDGDIEAIACVMTRDQYRALMATLEWDDPVDEIEWNMGIRQRPGGNPVTWERVVFETCEAFGWTVEEVSLLTIRQIISLRRGGRPMERGIVVRPGMDAESVRREMMRTMGIDGNGAD